MADMIGNTGIRLCICVYSSYQMVLKIKICVL